MFSDASSVYLNFFLFFFFLVNFLQEAYTAWVKSFKMYPIELVKRARSFWNSMRNWLAANFPEALNTLNRGASENQIKLTERTLGINLPLPTRILYRICNGQRKLTNSPKIEGLTYGIIGGYEFYRHFVNVHLLPLEQVVTTTKHVSGDLDFMERMDVVTIATSLNLRKLFFLDCNRGQLYVGTQNMVTDGELMPCVPESLIKLGDGADMLQDGLMVWLEEHLRRLQSGVIGTRVLRKYNSMSLFPEAPPLCSTAVTNGVKVCATVDSYNLRFGLIFRYIDK
jgi:F-box protein 3